MTAPVVTATRTGRGGKVEVHLDGSPWRALPAGAAAIAGLSVGVTLDRERARRLNRALRQEAALDTAERILRASDQTRASLTERLARRGVRARERDAAVETMVSASFVNDERFACDRAAALARKDMGDEGIIADLGARGVTGALVGVAIGALDPESTRAELIFAREGVTRRSAERLARRGFSESSLEWAIVQLAAEADTTEPRPDRA